MNSINAHAFMKKRSRISNRRSPNSRRLHKNKMKNSNLSKLILATLVLMSSALAAYAQAEQLPKKSAESSPTSDTGVNSVRVTASAVPSNIRTPKGVTLTAACNAAADELRSSRILIDALDRENTSLRERLETERLGMRLLTELNETRKAESEALKQTVAAKNETIAAKDDAINAQEKLIDTLRSKKRGIWSRIGDILIGAAAVAILK